MNTISWLQKISLCSLFKNDLCAYEYTFRKLISSYIISDAVRIIAYQSQNSVTDSLRSMSAPGRVINTTLTSWGLWPEDVSLFQENWPHDGGSRLQTWTEPIWILPAHQHLAAWSALPWRKLQEASSLHLKYLDSETLLAKGLLAKPAHKMKIQCIWAWSNLSFERHIEECWGIWLIYLISNIYRVK